MDDLNYNAKTILFIMGTVNFYFPECRGSKFGQITDDGVVAYNKLIDTGFYPDGDDLITCADMLEKLGVLKGAECGNC